jgi:hypothetical protein
VFDIGEMLIVMFPRYACLNLKDIYENFLLEKDLILKEVSTL